MTRRWAPGHMTVAVVLTLAACGALAACGGGDQPQAAPTATTPVATPPTASSPTVAPSSPAPTGELPATGGPTPGVSASPSPSASAPAPSDSGQATGELEPPASPPPSGPPTASPSTPPTDAATAPGSPAPSAAMLPGGPYESPEDGFGITFPPTWLVQEDAFGSAVAGLDPATGALGFAHNVNVFIEDLPDQSITVDQYAQTSVDNAPQVITDFALERQEPATVAGQPGGLLQYTGTQGTTQVRFLAVFTISDGRAYTITYGAPIAEFDASLPAAQGVLDSFRLL